MLPTVYLHMRGAHHHKKIKIQKVSKDQSCTATKSKETRNTEDSDIEIM